MNPLCAQAEAVDDKGDKKPFDGTGPYRRIATKKGLRFTTMRCQVHLPGGEATPDIDALPLGARKDAAHVYLGAMSKIGAPIDAGFQHSPTHDNWAPVLIGARHGQQVRSEDPLQFQRYRSNQVVTVELEILDDQVRCTYDGIAMDGSHQRFTATLALPGQSWNSSGNNISLKRTVSIAQPLGRQSFNNGSFICGVEYLETLVGRKGDLRPLEDSDIVQIQNHPRGEGKIRLQKRSAASELVSISLE